MADKLPTPIEPTNEDDPFTELIQCEQPDMFNRVQFCGHACTGHHCMPPIAEDTDMVDVLVRINGCPYAKFDYFLHEVIEERNQALRRKATNNHGLKDYTEVLEGIFEQEKAEGESA